MNCHVLALALATRERGDYPRLCLVPQGCLSLERRNLASNKAVSMRPGIHNNMPHQEAKDRNGMMSYPLTRHGEGLLPIAEQPKTEFATTAPFHAVKQRTTGAIAKARRTAECIL